MKISLTMSLFFKIFQGWSWWTPENHMKLVCFCGKIVRNGYLFLAKSLDRPTLFWKITPTYVNVWVLWLHIPDKSKSEYPRCAMIGINHLLSHCTNHVQTKSMHRCCCYSKIRSNLLCHFKTKAVTDGVKGKFFVVKWVNMQFDIHNKVDGCLSRNSINHYILLCSNKSLHFLLYSTCTWINRYTIVLITINV